MASDVQVIGARDKDYDLERAKDYDLESDKTVTELRGKDCDANETLSNGEFLNGLQLELPGFSKLPPELQNKTSIPSSLLINDTECSPMFSRCYVDNLLIGNGSSESSKSFNVATYNILADCHAGGEFDSAPWIKPEQLRIEYRHQNLMLELEFLNADAVCLQEVGQHYYWTTLAPVMKKLGYEGQFLRRLSEEHDEGEATFYKTCCFELVSYKEIMFSQIAEKDIEAMDVDLDVKAGLRSAVASHAVMLLTRLFLKAAGKIVILGNIHVAWDEFKRPDLQCIQIAIAMRELIAASEGTSEPSIICGDFNCLPGTAPYHLLEDGHLTREHLSSLMKVTCADGQKSPVATFWPQGFCYPEIAMKSAYKTILGKEPITCWGIPWVYSLDYIWYCSARLTVKSILETADIKSTEKGLPNEIFPSDHLSLKATFMLK